MEVVVLNLDCGYGTTQMQNQKHLLLPT